MTLKIDRVIGRRSSKEKIYFLSRPLHLTADGKVVEETDPAGVTVLGGAGSPISEADKEKYGLDQSHLLPDPALTSEPEVAPEPMPEPPPPEPEPEPVPVDNPLPEDFPGYAALAEAGITTYAQLAAIEDRKSIAGIGPATDEKIAEALKEN